MTSLDAFIARIEDHHAREVAAGKHDNECESRPNSRLCHCAKRRREASGFTELPGELIHQAPMCPRCYNDVDFDGDGWACQECSVSWSENGLTAAWTDDYGDLSRGPVSVELARGPRSVVDVHLPEEK